MTKTSPFPVVSRRKNRTNRFIDPDMLAISDDEFTGQRSSPEGKYDTIFVKMKPGQCLKCEPTESQRLAQALRNWIENRKLGAKYEVRSMQKYHTDQRGRVWLLEKEQLRKAA